MRYQLVAQCGYGAYDVQPCSSDSLQAVKDFADAHQQAQDADDVNEKGWFYQVVDTDNLDDTGKAKIVYETDSVANTAGKDTYKKMTAPQKTDVINPVQNTSRYNPVELRDQPPIVPPPPVFDAQTGERLVPLAPTQNIAPLEQLPKPAINTFGNVQHLNPDMVAE